MKEAIFANSVFYLRLKKLPIREKNRLKYSIKENGGKIQFVLNQECTHVVTDSADALSSTHLKSIQKFQLPVVDVDFIQDSIDVGELLQADDYEPHKALACAAGVPVDLVHGDDSQKKKDTTNEDDKNQYIDSSNVDSLRWLSHDSENIPDFPEDFEVAKYAILEKVTANGVYVVVELQCSQQQQCDFPFRIYAHYSMLDGHEDERRFIPAKTSDKARKIYALCIEHLKKEHFQLRKDLPDGAEHLASVKTQEILIEEAINSSRPADTVINFVELIWTEALGLLDDLLDKAVTSISLNDVSRAEGILLWIRKALDDRESPEKLSTMISEFYKIIPHKSGLEYDVNKKLLSSKQDLCQLIRDMLYVYEVNMLIPNTPSISKYRALRCKIDMLDLEKSSKIKTLIKENLSGSTIEVLGIYKVRRIIETECFESHLGNIRSLFHASSVSNIVGILSRGLLLPKIATEHGLERSDQGNLGSGIYFSDSVSVSMKYAQPSRTDGTRMLLICDVALGKCYNTSYTESSLTAAPSGYDSVHAVSKKEDVYSEFEHDEFAVYRTSQVKIKYVVQFCLVDDKIKEFSPVIPADFEDQVLSLEHQPQPEDYKIPSRALLDDITAGLQDKSGNPVPLKDIHIKGRIIDFIAEVVVFQTYENQTGSPIEAKYVFPLDDTAAVCGFEAFIKGKHIIGKVKEKEVAHREYREAVREGHGAYLMDQDTPDIFTVSVGNLPPSTKVLIKITYITELSYKNGCLSFHLPAAVAPWQQDKALNEITQDSVRKVSVKQAGIKPGSFSLQMSIEMPFKINHISSWTHQLKIKRTDCKAVICTSGDAFLDSSGFALEILIGDAYLPRMWVEKHPNKGSEACMLVFQPEFGASFDPLSISGEVVICLDCSNSMTGSVIQQAKQIALCAVASCQFSSKLSVFKFGTNFEEFPSHPKDFTMNFAALEKFITSATATMGNSDLWKTLRYLNLLYPSECKRNIVLISDGHIQNEGMTLQMVKQNAQHTRIFTCGVGPTANRHMLRSLAQYGAGAFEYFDLKSKYNWKRKVKNQTTRMFSPGCNAISIKWHQFDTTAYELKYAPAQIQALFNNECLLVYGFISRCTQATLNALVDNRELQAMVSTTELQKTTGTMLHKLAARAFIRDYEQGMFDENETEHEAKKHLLKSWIIQLSQENSIVTQFTSFVAIEKRDAKDDQRADTMDVLELVAKEDVDILPYMQYLPTTQGAPCQLDVTKDSIKSSLSEASPELALKNLGSRFLQKNVELSALQKSEMPLYMNVLEHEDITIDFKVGSNSSSSSSVLDEAHQQKRATVIHSSSPHSLSSHSRSPSCSSHSFHSSSHSRSSSPADFCCSHSPPPGGANFPPPPPPPPPIQHCFASPAAPSSAKESRLSSISTVHQTSMLFGAQPNSALQIPGIPVIGSAFSGRNFSGAIHEYSALLSQKAPEELWNRLPPPQFSHPFATLPLAGAAGSSSVFGSSNVEILEAPGTGSSSLDIGAAIRESSALLRQKAPEELWNRPPPPQFSHPFATLPLAGATRSSFVFGSSNLERQRLSDEGNFLYHPSKIAKRSLLNQAKKRATFRNVALTEDEQTDESLDGNFELQYQDLSLKKHKKLKNQRDISWPQVFKLQNQGGFWQLTPELGTHLRLDVDYLVNVQLTKNGIQSLGLKGKEKLLQLIATLLVLQLVWFTKLEGIIFKSLMKLNDSPPSWVLDPVQKAIEWARRTDREFPDICQRLELGKDWDSFTKKLLHIE